MFQENSSPFLFFPFFVTVISTLTFIRLWTDFFCPDASYRTKKGIPIFAIYLLL